MARRLFGAAICCVLVLIISVLEVKVSMGQRVVLKCNNDQKVDDSKLYEECRGKGVQKCILSGYRMDIKDEIYHPHAASKRVCLIFQRSTINTLPGDFFSTYASLRYIDLSHSKLESITDATFGIDSLMELNLSGNELSDLPANAFNGARNLQTLDLSKNFISTISPFAFDGLHSLVELNLSSNKLHNESFSSLGINWTIESLKTLDLSHNRIFYYQVMPYQSFSGLKNLEELFLHHNNIIIDYGAFNSNRHLRTLDLSYNAFPYFELDFLLSARNLQKLLLNGNGISYPSQLELSDINSAFPLLKSIAISNNSFACEVLASMIRKMDKVQIELLVEDDEFVNDRRNLRGIKCL